MTTPTVASPARAGPAAPGGPGICVSGVFAATFPDRREPLYSGDVRIAEEMLAASGLAGELGRRLGHRGNSFIAMGEELLRQVGGQLPRADAVILAYQVPDLHTPDVAGCYFAERLGGDAVPLSVDEQGPGAAFTALRIADAMFRLGEARIVALFLFDQNAAVWEESAAVQDLPDSAVLLLLGASGTMRVAESTELATAEPAAAIAGALARYPRARVLAGGPLRDRLGGLAADERVIPVPPGHRFTAAWMPLAGLWPRPGQLVVSDFDDYAGRLHSCLLVPGGQP